MGGVMNYQHDARDKTSQITQPFLHDPERVLLATNRLTDKVRNITFTEGLVRDPGNDKYLKTSVKNTCVGVSRAEVKIFSATGL